MSGPSLVAAVVLAAAAGAMLPSGRANALARLDGRPERRRIGGPVVVLVASAGAVATVGVLPVVLALVLAALGRRELRRRRVRREAERRRDVLGELLSALLAELHSGAEPRPALLAAAGGLGGLGSVVAVAARPSGDVAGALARLGGEPGGSTADELAAVWRLGEMTGCGLASPVARVLRGHRAQDRLRREVAAQLAGPTATAYLLSALPLVGVALGTALGADPVGFLLGAPAGRVTLVAGAVLVCVGVGWTRRITGSATAGLVAGPKEAH